MVFRVDYTQEKRDCDITLILKSWSDDKKWLLSG